MQDRLQSLFEAILGEDSPGVKRLLAADSTLATQSWEGTHRYETRITHWIYQGDTTLHVAAAGHRVEATRRLLATGAPVGAMGNHRRSQPLHYASDGHAGTPDWDEGRQVAVIRLLVEAGADLHAQDRNGATPLHRAVRTRCAAAVSFLLDAGATVTARNRSGSTAFHLAVQNTGRGGSGAGEARQAQHRIIQEFLARGALPTLTDGRGRSVLDWARSDGIRRLLDGGIDGQE